MSKARSIRQDSMLVSIDSKYIYISLENFVALFENSHIYYLADYKRALDKKMISINKLIKLSRKARIPYALFFAPKKVVEDNIKRNNNILFQGVDSGILSMAGRGSVEAKDINLIIKDIRKRQLLLAKHHAKVDDNVLSGFRTTNDVYEQAINIIRAIGLDMDKLRACKNKSEAYKYLVKTVEDANILISRSQMGVMPQSINPEAKFSGIAIKHNKYPAIFLYTKDESTVGDPTGRRIFSVVLLLVCISTKKYSPVSYDSNIKNTIDAFEYQVAEEILVPRSAIDGVVINTVSEVKDLAELFKVTPSMMLMRLCRIGVIGDNEVSSFFDELNGERQRAFENSKGKPYKTKDTTKVINYNGQ